MSDDIKAGRYELVATRYDQITSKPNEPFEFTRYRRGDVVTLNAEDAHRLVTAGAVVKPGELERQAAMQARLVYEAALAALPDDVRAELTGTATEDDGTGEGDQLVHPPLDRPKRTAPIADWLAFRRVPSDQAKGLTIGNLQDDEFMDDWAVRSAVPTPAV